MIKQLAPLTLISLLSGCTLINGDRYHQETLSAIGQLQASTEQTHNQVNNLQLQLSNQSDYIDSLESEVISLRDQVNAVETTMKQQQKQRQQVKVSQNTAIPAQPAPQQPRQELVLGSVESVYLDTLKQHFDARVDTGAATSSLNAVNIEEFERNGKEWVKFQLQNTTDSKLIEPAIEVPVLRYVKIRQATSDEPVRRAVVQLWVKVGKIHEKAQFTLADRSQMTHPVLLGRAFIRDIALVDVSKQYVQTAKPEPNSNH